MKVSGPPFRYSGRVRPPLQIFLVNVIDRQNDYLDYLDYWGHLDYLDYSDYLDYFGLFWTIWGSVSRSGDQ